MNVRRVVVVGGGGREHALAWRLRRDPEAPEVWVSPGNDATRAAFGAFDADATDSVAFAARCREREVDLVVIGPEAPLEAGLADALALAGVTVFGPARDAAKLEWSKWHAKDVMRAAGVPTARAERHDALPAAREALARFEPPWVLKADGLAAGKGVRVTSDRGEAEQFLDAALLAGPVVIEAFLRGEEASVMAVCDGRRHVLLTPARDYKRAHDGDRGLNTGGMGAYAPATIVTAEVETLVSERVVAPVLAEMERRGTPYRGVLYCGLMIGADGVHVVEFNARFGDPETEVILPLTGGSLSRLLASAARGALDPGAVARLPGSAVAVALVADGYPETTGEAVIEGLDAVAREGERLVFHAATSRDGEAWRTRGGRAGFVVGLGASPSIARGRAYEGIDALGGSGWRCRRDIGADAGAHAASERSVAWR